jgi:hypothetical protein
MPEGVISLVSEIYRFAFDQTFKGADHWGYIFYVLNNFIRYFLSETEARIFIRKLDIKKKQMVVIKTTSSIIPSPIPLSEKNMITASMNSGTPLIYSRNLSFHCER